MKEKVAELEKLVLQLKAALNQEDQWEATALMKTIYRQARDMHRLAWRNGWHLGRYTSEQVSEYFSQNCGRCNGRTGCHPEGHMNKAMTMTCMDELAFFGDLEHETLS